MQQLQHYLLHRCLLLVQKTLLQMMNKLFWKFKGLISQKSSGRGTDRQEKMTLTTKSSRVSLYLLAILSATSFYLFEFFPDSSSEYLIAQKEHTEAKKKRTIALNNLKEFAKGTEVYRQYLIEKEKTDKAWQTLLKAKNEQRVFGCTNLKQFMGEFGTMLGLFIYALVNLFRSFYFEPENAGMKLFHGLIISVTMFYFFWMFGYYDYSSMTYYLMTFFSAGVVVLAVYLITKYQDHYINRLKYQVSRLAAFSFLHTKQEKKSEMLNLFRELSE